MDLRVNKSHYCSAQPTSGMIRHTKLVSTFFKTVPFNRKIILKTFKVAAHVGRTQRLSEKTICMASLAGENDEYLHYEVHNLYGYSHAIATQM